MFGTQTQTQIETQLQTISSTAEEHQKIEPLALNRNSQRRTMATVVGAA